MKNIFPIAFLCILLFGLSGCATVEHQRMYPGEPRAPSEVATLTAPNAVDVLAIDGERMPKLTRHIGAKERIFELLPGTHTITARYYQPNDYDVGLSHDAPPDRSSPVDLELHAAANAAYNIDYVIDGKTITLSLHNTSGREMIAPDAAPAPATAEPPDLRTLKKAWGEASAEEQKAFRDWIINTP